MAMLQVFRIEEDSKKEALLEVISDKYCRDIMNCVMDKPRSALEITADTGIPVSTVYRRIQSLCDAKLLAVSGDISDDGKKFYLYKSKVKLIQSVYNDGKVEVEMIFN
jgi:predicted transcriptional regulator